MSKNEYSSKRIRAQEDINNLQKWIRVVFRSQKRLKAYFRLQHVIDTLLFKGSFELGTEW